MSGDLFFLIIFAVTGVLDVWAVVACVIAFKRVVMAYRAEGHNWQPSADPAFIQNFVSAPDRIILTTDSTLVRAAKAQLIATWKFQRIVLFLAFGLFMFGVAGGGILKFMAHR